MTNKQREEIIEKIDEIIVDTYDLDCWHHVHEAIADWHLAKIDEAEKKAYDKGWDTCQKLMKDMANDAIKQAEQRVASEIKEEIEKEIKDCKQFTNQTAKEQLRVYKWVKALCNQYLGGKG